MKILVMCVANSARSQLAEGLARAVFPDAEIASAGSNPGMLNPYAVRVMKEIGIDISGQYSKSVSELPPEFISHLDYVITLCAEEVCPMVISRAKKIHWPHPDPASQESHSEAETLDRFRQARDSILSMLKTFQQEILP